MASDVDPTPARVLIVGDDAASRQTLCDALRGKGYVVYTAAGGDQGVDLLGTTAVDVAVVDIELPDSSDLGLLDAIKLVSPITEVVFVAAQASISTVIQGINGAAFAYLTKPFAMDQLLATVQKAREKQVLVRDLRESEERCRLVTEHIHDAVFVVDLDGEFVFGNRRVEELTGYAPDELVGRSIFSVLTTDAARAAEARRAALRSGYDGAFVYDAEILRKDGTTRWVEVNSSSVVVDSKTVARIVAARDITQRRDADRRRAAEYAVGGILAEAESVAAAAVPVLRAIGDAFDWQVGTLWAADEAAGVLRCVDVWQAEGISVPAFERATRDAVFAREAGLPGRVWASGEPLWIADVAQEPNVARAALALDEGLHGFVGFPVALGHDVTGVVEFSSHAIRPPHGALIDSVVSLGRQIAQFSQRKEAESRLRETNATLEALIQSLAVSVVAVDLEGRVTLWNKTAERLLGWSEAEALGLALPMVPDDQAEEAERSRQLWLQGVVTTDVEVLRRRKDGSLVPMSRAGGPLRNAHGEVIGTIANLVDISDRKRTEAALRTSEERFRATFEQAAVGIGIKTPDGRWARVNQRLCDMLGYLPEELLGRPFLDITHPDDIEVDRLSLQRFVTGEIHELSREKRFVHKNGSAVWTQLTVSLPRDASGQPDCFIAIIQDITERKRLEEDLRHAQRMEGVGQLAGGIAHDFNNLLTVISGRSHLGIARLGAADPLRRDLELIQKTSDRAAALTRQLLAFSRKQVLQPKVVALNELVAASTTMLRRLIGEDIDLTFVGGADLGRVRVDPGQLEQVIVNLAVNARDAMPDGGRLTVQTTNVDLDEEYAARHVHVVPGRYVVLAVTDSGIGMSREVQARIFEPFFTTKGPGKGTGLGLATVYGIVKQSGGHVRVYSEPGAGTTFRIYFPRTDEAPEEPTVKRSEALPGGTETILLVEDEAEVRSYAREALGRLGYTVLEAALPTDATLIAERHVGIIDLLLTDVVMPRMSGRALADAVTAERPGIKVLFTSGYTDDAIVRHGVLEPGIQFLEKPFTPHALAVKVREVLDHRSPAKS